MREHELFGWIVQDIKKDPNRGRMFVSRKYSIGEKKARLLVKRAKEHLGIRSTSNFEYVDEPLDPPSAKNLPPLEFTYSDEKITAKGAISGKDSTEALNKLKDELKLDEKFWKIDTWSVKRYQGFYATEEALESSDGRTCKVRNGHEVVTMWSIKASFVKKDNSQLTLERLLKRLEEASIPVPNIHISKPKIADFPHNRALEISIMDPHATMVCYTPQSDNSWSPEEAAELYFWCLEDILEKAYHYGPFSEIMLPIGNDLVHADNVWHATTAGTPQPEAVSWHEGVLIAEEILITAINRLKEIAPVNVISIMGNHARQTEFMLGRTIAAWYRNDENVTVDASPSPYKAWNWGVNLIGLEHGHSVKPTVRMAALMANEWPDLWLQTAGGYREWHLGDQHRKATNKPSSFEEQGVSIEFLPGLTPPNEWHRLKSYNWQKRAGLGYVWDWNTGPVARLCAPISSTTGRPVGENSL